MGVWGGGVRGLGSSSGGSQGMLGVQGSWGQGMGALGGGVQGKI